MVVRPKTSTTLVRREIVAAGAAVPALYAPTPAAAKRFIEYFAAHIRNPNTRRAYLRAVREFAHWCAVQRFDELVDIEPLHVAAYIEQMTARLAKPSVKQHLAAIRMLFTGVLPFLTAYLGPRTGAAGFVTTTWPTTSGSRGSA